MLMTSAEAAKYLRKLKEELASLENRENQSRQFTISVGEKEEDLRPAYDYAACRDAMLALEEKIRRVRHALNVFNCGTEVPGFAMTVDQMLIYLPQLTARKNKLALMKDVLPRTRATRYNSNLVEYRYANYDPAQAKADLEAVTDELSKAQTALDTLNNTKRFSFEM